MKYTRIHINLSEAQNLVLLLLIQRTNKNEKGYSHRQRSLTQPTAYDCYFTYPIIDTHTLQKEIQSHQNSSIIIFIDQLIINGNKHFKD